MSKLSVSSSSVPKASSLRRSAGFSNSGIPRDVLNKFDAVRHSGLNGELNIEEVLRTKIASEVATTTENAAFFVVDLGKVARKHAEFVSLLPRVTPFFAVKCNPNTAIIKVLASLGAGFDCASRAEIQQVLGCGVAPTRIIYANPCKMKSHIEFAKTSHVDRMTFDNASELIKISETFHHAKLVLRIITDDSNSACQFSSKFGAPLDETYRLLSLARELGLDVVGVSFHVGSGCSSAESFVSAVKNARKVFDEAEELGYHLTLLDLGGGWPGTNDGRIAFKTIADAVRPVIDELFPGDVEVIAEPGRYYVCESHTLAVNVFSKRTKVDANTGEKTFLYYLNDGIYGSFNNVYFDHYTPEPLVLNDTPAKDKTFKSTLFGPTCDSIDTLGKNIELPELEVGDWLYFKNMGAYTTAAASNFNGFDACPHIYYVF